MKMITARELSAGSGKLWSKLAANDALVVTKDGKPKAFLIPTSEDTFIRDYDSFIRARARDALREMQKQAQEHGASQMTLDEINAMIAEVRSEWSSRKSDE